MVLDITKPNCRVIIEFGAFALLFEPLVVAKVRCDKGMRSLPPSVQGPWPMLSILVLNPNDPDYIPFVVSATASGPFDCSRPN